MGRGHPRTGHEDPDGEQRFNSTLPLISVLDEGGWSAPRPGHLSPGKRPGTHCTANWVGPRAGINVCGKISPLPGFDPLTVQPVASRCTN
jgi:hypothetical protein